MKKAIAPVAAVAITLRICFSPAIIGFGGELLVNAVCVVPLLLWLFSGAASGRFHVQRKMVLWPTALFAATVLISPLFASYSFGALQTGIGWLAHLALFFAVVNGPTGAWRLPLSAAVSAAAVQAASGVWYVVEGWSLLNRPELLPSLPAALQEEAAKRLATPVGNIIGNLSSSNILASFLILFGPVLLAACFTKSRGRQRALTAPAALLAVACFLLCLSFGGYLAAGLAGALALFIRLGTVGRTRAIWLAGGVVLLGAIGVWVVGPDRLYDNRSVDVRRIYWEAAGKVWLNNPWTGVGLGNFGDAYTRYREPSPEAVNDPHNSVIRMFCELGVFGGAAFLLAWHLLIRPHFRRGLRLEEQPSPQPLALPTAMICAIATTGAILYQGSFSSDPLLLQITAPLLAMGLWGLTFCSLLSLPTGPAHRALLVGLCGALAHSLIDQSFEVGAMSASLWLSAALLPLMVNSGKRPAERLLTWRGRAVLFGLSGMIWTGLVVGLIAGVMIFRNDKPWEAVPSDADAVHHRAIAPDSTEDERSVLLKKAIQLRPERASYHSDYGMLLWTGSHRSVPNAERELQLAVGLDPNGLIPRLRLAKFYASLSNSVRAKQEYQEVLRIDTHLRKRYPDYALEDAERTAIKAAVGLKTR